VRGGPIDAGTAGRDCETAAGDLTTHSSSSSIGAGAGERVRVLRRLRSRDGDRLERFFSRFSSFLFFLSLRRLRRSSSEESESEDTEDDLARFDDFFLDFDDLPSRIGDLLVG